MSCAVTEPPLHLGVFRHGSSELDDLVAIALREQQVTAVEEFAQWHQQESAPLQSRFYRNLLPATAPKEGQQYAFEVDLDACSGCKACVVACHNLNGLEAHETWRSVGLLLGGSDPLPILQHVTTACHHCVEPACLDGCPVEAYEKDPVTGIVRHLDDQCIGCQYCILKCPYDVPKYSAAKGIVRKCDMCSNRLAVGEAPACVQSCPNQAIRITVVNKIDAVMNAEANLFLPGAPEPRYTLPTSVYKAKRALATNLLPADYFAAAPQHAHIPLVVMLVLTQMSVGSLLVDQLLSVWTHATQSRPIDFSRGLDVGAALALGVIGLGASIFHLGRPWLAYRAIIGWRTSWLSREVLAFGAFASLAVIYAGLVGWASLTSARIPVLERIVGGAVVMAGLLGVLCSMMIYVSTRRVYWSAGNTGPKFFLTCVILGSAVVLFMHSIVAASSGNTMQLSSSDRIICIGLAVASGAKLLAEASIFAWLGTTTLTPLRRTAMLMMGVLRRVALIRFVSGFLGGVVAPLLLWVMFPIGSSGSTGFVLLFATAIVSLNLTGEILERYLFFSAVIAPKMPGAPAG
jgi:formate dehydrogenase iron-sulfur subunit